MFSKFFIDRPIFATVISIVIILLGFIMIPMMPVEKTPNITPPTVNVSTVYPGASAEVVAKTVATPLEEEINGVENMLYMSSKSSDDGTMSLTITFKVGTDIDMATVHVQNRVATAEPLLPEEVKRQGVTTEKQSSDISLVISLISPGNIYDEIYISNYVKTQIKDALTRVEGVGDIIVFGAKDFAMRVWINPEELKIRGLTAQDITEAIREQNVQVAAGRIAEQPIKSDEPFLYTVKTLGRLDSVEQFKNIIIKTTNDGRILRLKDIANVELGSEYYSTTAEYNGQNTVAIGIFKRPGSNSLAVAEGVLEKMDELAENFPQGINYEVAYNPSTFIDESIKEVLITLIFTVLLVVLTVYVFLENLRATLIPAVTIPVSLIGTFAVMQLMGISINTLTLFGLVLVIGIVVDDAIVVVENTMRIIDEEKLSPKAAITKAMGQITGPVIATTLVLLAVFVPTILIGGITGRLYSQFAITISTATVFSTINALTLSPALCGLFLKPMPEKRGWFFSRFDRFLKSTTERYTVTVKGLLRKLTIVVVLFAGMLGLSYAGIKTMPTGFIPQEDEGFILVSVKLPDAANLNRTEEVMKEVDEILKSTAGVKNYVSISGYSLLDSLASSNGGTCFIELDQWDKRTSPELQIESIVGQIQMRLFGIQDAFVLAFAPPPIHGLGFANGFEIQVQDRGGAGLQKLEEKGNEISYIADQSPLLTRLNSTFRANVPQIYLDIDRTKAKTLGVALNTIFSTLQMSLGSYYVNDFNLFGKTYKVEIQADQEFRSKIDDIEKLEVRNNDGEMVPLSTLCKIEETVGPQYISRYNMFPSTTISGCGMPGVSSGEAMKEIEKICDETLPSNMGFEWSGMSYQEIEAGNKALMIFSLSFVFVFLFLAAQYESWAIPLAIVLSIPIALFGAIAFTWMRAYENNIYTQIGLVLLIGVASKTAILLVEFAKQQHEAGENIYDAAVEAARLRFRPILMTALSFVFGVFPLVIASGAGANSRRALGTAVCGGMFVATVLGVFAIPTFYVLVQRVSDWIWPNKEYLAHKEQYEREHPGSIDEKLSQLNNK